MSAAQGQQGGAGSFNSFQIRRKAHAVSRRETSLSTDQWNPFRNVWAKSHQRSQAWDAEAQAGLNEAEQDDAGTSPIEPTLTAPPGASYRLNDDYQPERGESSGQNVLPSQDVSDNGLRKRKTDRVESPTSAREDEKPKKYAFFKTIVPMEPYTTGNQIQRTLLAAWINVLLVCVPAGIILNSVVGSSIATFVVNFIAIIPLYFLNDLAMGEIDMRLGRVASTFLNISTSNLFQLISCILLLVRRQVTVLKLSLIGGILTNILLLLGLAILCGALRRPEQYFNMMRAHTSSIMLSLTSTSLLIPTACLLLAQTSPENVIKQSRGVAIVLILIYSTYLWCTLKTHYTVFAMESVKVPKRPHKNALDTYAIRYGMVKPAGLVPLPGRDESGMSNHDKLLRVLNEVPFPEEAEEEEEADPKLHFLVAIFVFLATAALLFLCTDYIVDSIDALLANSGLSATFVGLILLPIPNCDSLPVTCAIHDEMDTALELTVVKSIQTALLVLPFTVLLGWWMGIEDATLVFDGFEVVSVFATIILLNLIIGRGSTIWVMGVLLVGDWVLIAVAAYYVD